ncbi:hypothetical protein [Pseudokordiimonas caeni]|uniref:hypothetical protein n=1 Tax=Pseudokordiimonas caeni TaxID=2997908 RepID=UPI0028124CD0|nr:hypothetical protein [Pseudokordiimonas caeni]
MKVMTLGSALRSLAFAGLVAAGTSAMAAPIPEDLLAVDQQRCMKGCVPGYGEATCKPLCDCTVREFKNRLDMDKYLSLSVELSKNEVSDTNRTLLDDIAKMCAAEIEKANIPVGEPQAETPQP